MGEIYALACALVWAFAVILFQRSMERVGALALNLFRSSVSVPLLLITLALTGTPLLRAAPARDYLILVASGVIGIAIADTLFHYSLNLVGAGISAIVSTVYSPMVVLLTFLFLGERLSAVHLAGMVLIASGVFLSGRLVPPPNRTHRQLAWGIALGAIDMLLLVVSVVLAKPVLDHSPVIWATAVRQCGAFVVLLLMAVTSPRRREHFSVYRPAESWRFMLPGSALGSYVALILWIAGFKYTLASLAAILTQTTTIFILLLAVIFLHERMTPRKLLAAALALAGVLLIVLT
jgi:drug/metabolite transporter (DMT)-like permease